MLPCPGATPDEAVLDPYVYAGQHAGSSISGWLLSLSTLMMLGVVLQKPEPGIEKKAFIIWYNMIKICKYMYNCIYVIEYIYIHMVLFYFTCIL